jgi:hypothetical protein
MTRADFREFIDRLFFLLTGRSRELDQRPSLIGADAARPAGAAETGEPSCQSSFIWDREIDGLDEILLAADPAPEPAKPVRDGPMFILGLVIALGILVLLMVLPGLDNRPGRPGVLPGIPPSHLVEWLILALPFLHRRDVATHLAEGLQRFKELISGRGPRPPAPV